MKTATYDSSNDRRAFTILREDATATLGLVKDGGKRTLVASLHDADDPQRPVTAAVVAFYADGEFIGDRITNADGVAVLEIPPGSRGKNTTYTVSFAGNGFFGAATAQV